MNTMNITPRQMEILRYIRDYRSQNGYSPTMQEIGDSLGLTKVTVFEHVGALEKKGALLRGAKHKARSLQVSPKVDFPENKPTRLPLIGRIAAGRPIEAIEDPETLDLEEVFPRSEGTFVLRVKGDSMIEEQIRDGDFVVCERRTSPRNGETVVAVVDQTEATLKKFYKESGRVRLQPANPRYQPIYSSNVDVRGVVVGVLRVM